MAGTVTFKDNSDDVVSALNKAKHAALMAIGMVAETYAKQQTPVDTGRLRNSITYAISGYQAHVQQYRRDNVEGGAQKKHTYYGYEGTAEGMKDEAVYIGTNVEYAPFIELGHRGYAGRHMLQDAAANHGEEYKALMLESMKNAQQ